MTALIIGGSKGIGREIAKGFAAPGKSLAIAYASDDAAADRTAAELRELGATVQLLKADVGDPDGARALAARLSGKVERIEQLIHCAVWPRAGKAMELATDDFDRAVRINGSSLFYLVQATRPLLQAGSSIVFLSSYGSKVAIRGYMALGAPKALAEALIRYLAVELGPEGIRINAVTPSALPTDALQQIVPDVAKLLEAQAKATPVKRNPGFEDVVAAVKFLCSPEAGMISGRELVLDGALYLKA